MYKIGIDLSTRCIGIAIMRKDKLIDAFDWKMERHIDANLIINIKSLETLVQKINLIMEKNGYKGYDFLTIGIEVSNLTNPSINQKFSEYCGMLEMGFNKELAPYNNQYKIIKFNSSQWQSLIGCLPSDVRIVRKQKSRLYVNRIYKLDYKSDDINDAICIATFLEQLNSTEEKKILVRTAKDNIRINRREKDIIKQKILIRERDIKKLDPINNSKRIATLQAKVNDLKKELEKKNEMF